MAVFVPLVFLIAGMTTVMALIMRNLDSLEREAADAWRRVQDLRTARDDAAQNLCDCARDSAALSDAEATEWAAAISRSRSAQGAKDAAAADDRVASLAIDLDRSLTSASAGFSPLASAGAPAIACTPSRGGERAVKPARDLETTENLKNALRAYHEADEAIAQARQLFNNRVVMHNNAGVTFPAVLVAKRKGFIELARYRPVLAAGSARDHLQNAGSDTLAEASPRVMNAYMLWAVGLSGATMDEAGPSESGTGEPPEASGRAITTASSSGAS